MSLQIDRAYTEMPRTLIFDTPVIQKMQNQMPAGIQLQSHKLEI